MSEGADDQNANADVDQAALTSSAPLDPALACFILLAKFLGVPADHSQIHHDRGQGDEPYTLENLARIAKKLGLISRLRDAKREELSKIPLPAILRTHDGGAFILLKIEEDSRYQCCGSFEGRGHCYFGIHVSCWHDRENA